MASGGINNAMQMKLCLINGFLSHKMLRFDKPMAQPVVAVRDYLNKACK